MKTSKVDIDKGSLPYLVQLKRTLAEQKKNGPTNYFVNKILEASFKRMMRQGSAHLKLIKNKGLDSSETKKAKKDINKTRSKFWVRKLNQEKSKGSGSSDQAMRAFDSLKKSNKAYNESVNYFVSKILDFSKNK